MSKRKRRLEEEWGLGQNSACAAQTLSLDGHADGVEVVGDDAAGAAVGGQASKRINEEGFLFSEWIYRRWIGRGIKRKEKSEREGMRTTRIQVYG